jgi:hypothetical protein
MSMNPEPIRPSPEETGRVAKAAFPKGNVYIEMRGLLRAVVNEIGSPLQWLLFEHSAASSGMSGAPPIR